MSRWVKVLRCIECLLKDLFKTICLINFAEAIALIHQIFPSMKQGWKGIRQPVPGHTPAY